MAVVFESVSTFEASVSASDTAALPTGVTAGDLLVAWVSGRPANTHTDDDISIGSSWAQHSTRISVAAGGANDVDGEVWWKIAGASETAPTVTVGADFTNAVGGGIWQITICRISGADTTTPFDATAVTDSSGAAATWTPTGITTATAGAMVVSFVATRDDNQLALDTGNEQGFTLQAGGAAYNTTGGSDHAIGIASKVQATAGAVTNPTWAQPFNPSDHWIGTTVAVKPAASGGSEVTGTATGAFAFSAPATGTREVAGAATGAFVFSGPAAGTVAGSTAKAETLVDTFDDGTIDTGIWSPQGTVTETGGRCVMAYTAGFDNEIQTVAAYDLTSSHVAAEVYPAASTTAGIAFFYCIDGAEYVQFEKDQATLEFVVSGTVEASVDYSPTDHRWWRFEHDGTNILWRTSPDGSTWTTRHTELASVLTNPDAVTIGWGCGGLAGENLEVDNVNSSAGAVTGTATGAFAFAGPAAGTREVAGAATGAFVFSGPAAGTTAGAVTGTATGAFAFAGLAAGTRTVDGQATGAFTFSAPASGTTEHPATATGTFTFAGPAAGTVEVPGTATGAFSFAGPATGTVERTGTATGAFTFSGPAAGTVTSPGAGVATGDFTFAAPATGTVEHPGTATGTFAFAGPAAGTVKHPGTATGAFTFTAPASGTREVTATATGAFVFAAPAAATTAGGGTGTATGAFSFAGPATGTVERTGTATGTFAFAGAASGTRTVKGVAAGVFDFSGPIVVDVIPPLDPTRRTIARWDRPALAATWTHPGHTARWDTGTRSTTLEITA